MLVDGSDVTKGDEGVVAWKERPNFSSAILCGDVVTRGHDHIVLRLYIRWSNRVSCCPGYGKIWDQTNASTTEDSGTMICFASREIRHFFVRRGKHESQNVTTFRTEDKRGDSSELIRPQLARRRTVEITRERRKHDGQGNTLTLTLTLTHLFQLSNRWDESSDNRR